MRTNDDTWDVTESVGQTAIQVALGRMAETHSDAPLFTDPYAEIFVQAAVEHGWTSPFTEETFAELIAVDPLAPDRLQAMQGYTAVRTRFFDDFLVDASRRGMTQAVIVAAGLDSRPWRLSWPTGGTVYELDRPEVLAFKVRVLEHNGMRPAARYAAVGTDLRLDWRAPLQHNGFDITQPTAWIVEGLLPYLSATDQDTLFERIDELSARGSRVAVEAFDDRFYDPGGTGRGGADLVGRVATTVNGQPANTDQLFFLEHHADVAQWLGDRGWATTTVDAAVMMDRYGRPVREDLRDRFINSVFVDGER